MRSSINLLILTCIVVFMYVESQAQHGISVGISAVRTSIHTEQMNTFFQEFNKYHDGAAFVPFKDFRSSVISPGFTGGWRFQKEGGGFSGSMLLMYGWDKQDDYNTKLIQNSGYELIYKSRNTDFILELGYNIKDRVFIHFVTGAGYSDESIAIWKVYANGDKTMTNENDLPGHYESSTGHLSFGGSLGIKIGKVYIPFRVTYAMPFMGAFTDAYEALPFMDHSNIHKWRASEIPTNYELWVRDLPGFAQESVNKQNTVHGDFRIGWRFQIGVEIAFFFDEKGKFIK